MDTYTIFLTDGSSYDFKVPNPAVSLDVESYRIKFDNDYNIIDLPYYVGTSIPMDLLVYAQYADGSEMRVQDGDYTVTGFSTETAGTRDATVEFGPVSADVEYKVIDISEEIGAALAEVGATDVVPGFAAGVYDYEYYTMGNQLAVTLDEDVAEGDAVTAYQAVLEAAGYTNVGEDKYGDIHFVSENEQLDVCAWKGSDIGYDGQVFVDIKVLKGYFPVASANEFMEAVGYDFTFGNDIRDAFGIAAWDSRIGQSSSGRYYFLVTLEGDHAAEWLAILTPVLEENGFEWSDQYGFVNWTTYKQIMVGYSEANDLSYIQINQ